MSIFAPPPGIGTGVTTARENDFKIYGMSPELPIGGKDGYGVYWWWQDIKGWFDSTNFTPTVVPVGNSDYGTWNTRFPRAPKTYTIEGTCYAGDKYSAFQARERLMRYWGDPNTVFRMIVDEPTGAKWAEVRLNSTLSAPWTGSYSQTRGYTFEIPLIAKDSLRYSVDSLYGSTASQPELTYGLHFPITFPLTFDGLNTTQYYAEVTNVGNENAPCLLTLQGAIADGWRITNLDDKDSSNPTGKTLWVNHALGGSDTMALDSKTGQATINGVSADLDTYGSWFSLVPGLNRIQLHSSVPTSAVLTVSGYSAWR